MIELIQFPWSPFCIVQRRILEFGGVKFRTVNIPNPDRTLVWKLTRQRYYEVPIIKDGKDVIFEPTGDAQAIAKYVDDKFQLGLFPHDLEGVQSILWRFIEGEVESRGFKLNDIYYEEMVPPKDWLGFVRHKERKFGRGCLSKWREQQTELLVELAEVLLPFEEMVTHKSYLIEPRPRFVDFDLFGMLSNFLYSGHYQLPKQHTRLKVWFDRMSQIKLTSLQ
ncbi:MAG: glutathione S-transferase family protein [Verrucomicrobiales bacterium]|nr:glutathione S-transferase family protein [Verrucomicrobiales bacterium]